MKRIVVTGANKGIGLAIVIKLLKDYPDTYLLLGSRDEGRGKAAMEQVIQQLGDNIKNRLELLLIDVTSDQSVADAVASIKANHGESEPLYGLINNAGGTTGSSTDAARGTINLNMYGLIRVTEAFMPLIQRDKGRVVQISSAAGPKYVEKCSTKIQEFFVKKDVTWKEIENTIINPYLKIDEDNTLDAEKKSTALKDLGLTDGGRGTLLGAYGVSKSCVNAYTVELARRFPSMLINSCTPGFIETDLTKPFYQNSGKTASEMGMLPVEAGAVSANYLMMGDLLGDIDGYESGRFYGSDAKRSPFHKYRSPQEPPYDGTFP